jgi:hypothetical protein
MKKVKSLAHLLQLSIERKSVVCPDFKVSGLPPFAKPKAAAFIMSMQARQVEKLFKAGLFVYQPVPIRTGTKKGV